MQLVEAGDIGSLVRMLLRQRIDALYANPEVLRYYLAEHTDLGSDRVQMDPELPLARTAFHASSLNHPQLLEAFDRFLADQAAELARLRREYGLACGPSDQAEALPACNQAAEAR
ncbi:hypothetical protein D3C72_2101560 [compost metagenome]